MTAEPKPRMNTDFTEPRKLSGEGNEAGQNHVGQNRGEERRARAGHDSQPPLSAGRLRWALCLLVLGVLQMAFGAGKQLSGPYTPAAGPALAYKDRKSTRLNSSHIPF